MKQLCLGLVTAPKLYPKNKKVPQRHKKFDFIIREIWHAPLGNFTKMKGMLVYFQRQNAYSCGFYNPESTHQIVIKSWG